MEKLFIAACDEHDMIPCSQRLVRVPWEGAAAGLTRCAVAGLQYHKRLCEYLETYDRAFIVGADNVGSKQFADIRAVRGAGQATLRCGPSPAASGHRAWQPRTDGPPLRRRLLGQTRA